MNQKAFTLIELLAVIVILSIIILIAVPRIMNIIDESKMGAFRDSVYGIVKSAENGYAKNLIKGEEPIITEYIYVDTKESQNGNISLEYKGSNPDSGSLVINTNGKIAFALYKYGYCATKTYNSEEINISKMEIKDNCEIDLNIFTVNIKGGTPTYVEINDIYYDNGIEIIGEDGKSIDYTVDMEILKNDIKVLNVDTSEIGEYNILYKVTLNERSYQYNRKVIVRDTIKPIIEFPENTSISVGSASSFNLMTDVTITDNSSKTIHIEIIGELLSLVGEYEIIYKATDLSGNYNEKVRIISVLDSTAPIVTFSPNGNSQWSKSHSTKVTVTDSDGHVDNSSLKYYFSTSTSMPNDNLFIDSFANDSNINTPSGLSGNYYLWILAKDTAGNQAKTRSNVFRLDNTNPSLTIPADTSITTINVPSFNIMTGVSASDNSGTSPTITTSGSLSSIAGSYTIIYTATDTSGNYTSKSRKITVTNPPYLVNVVNQGDYVYYEGKSLKSYRVLSTTGSGYSGYVQIISDGYIDTGYTSPSGNKRNFYTSIINRGKEELNATYATSANLPKFDNFRGLDPALKSCSASQCPAITSELVYSFNFWLDSLADYDRQMFYLSYGKQYSNVTTSNIMVIVTLKNNMVIQSGTGTKTDPYKIMVNS